MNQRSIIAVALSGGMDSAMAAALLKDDGHAVIGLTARMWQEGRPCPAPEDVARAAEIARLLGIPHHIVDMRKAFEREVIAYFVAEYARGRTPSPCVVCNRQIKFGVLFEQARALGAGQLATGHYARCIRDDAGRCHLLRGVDQEKDQSYFLFALSPRQLARSVFPLGDLTHQDVHRQAGERGFPVREARTSQDLCFVTAEDYVEFLERRRPELRKKGSMVDLDGHLLREHEGVHRFTVGQRRGLGLAAGRPVYVARLDAAGNRVVIGERADLMTHSVRVGSVHWLLGRPPPADVQVATRIRYNHRAASSRLHLETGGTVAVRFDEPQFAAAPGQAAVFYAGPAHEEVLGGGWIEGE
ncbi:MAG: tRNA 2-thiouridine(34) synthase MnmA [Kiritimatiellae bacterium]|nr:tRNA 2-thiouridine(34) synthase MnmA [Kiritimatiellia bacterium]